VNGVSRLMPQRIYGLVGAANVGITPYWPADVGEGPPAGRCSSRPTRPAPSAGLFLLSVRPRGETTFRSLIRVMVGVGLGYIVTDAIWVVVVIRVMVGGVMIIWVAVIVDLLDVRLDDRLGE
jgi:hypothetical protein